jgi:hypothetical protein
MPNNFRVRLTGVLMAQLHENQFHMQQTGAGPFDPMALATHIRDNWCQIWRDMFSISEFSWTNIRVTNLDNPGSAPVNLPVNIAGSGLSITAGSPALTYNVRKLTQFAGKHGRGRMYIGRVSSSNLGTNGMITTTALASLNVRCTNAMAVYGPAGSSVYKLVLMREKDPVMVANVTSLFFDAIPRIQRRRNIGVGS